MRHLKLQHFNNAERGSVITEAIVVIPLLLLFFMLILESGRTATQVARAAQSAYNATLAGGKSPRSIRLDTMRSRANDINTLLVDHLDINESTPVEDLANRTVAYKFSGGLQPLFPALHWGVGVGFVGPDLMLGEGNSVDYESFADGRCYYDCNLNRTNTCTQPFGSHTCGNVLMGGPDDDRAEVGGGFTVDPGDHSVNIDVQLVKGGLLQEIGP